MNGEIWGIAAVVIVVGGGIIAHTKAVQSWYDKHTTAKERLIADEVARAGLAVLDTAFPKLEGRVKALEDAIAVAKAAEAPAPAAQPAATPAQESAPKGA